jgi:hypothetical protein
MVEIFRVENDNGAGPYFWFAICGDLRFGFASRDQFEQWWNADQRRELAKRYRLNTYSVASEFVHDGEGEVSFDKSKSTLIASENIL